MNSKNDKTTRTRRQHSAEEKVRLLKLHLVDGQPISAICDQHQIHPTLFYGWQKTFFENGAAAFDSALRPRGSDVGTRRVEQLEARLKRKDEVIAAVTEELVRTKKEFGRAEGVLDAARRARRRGRFPQTHAHAH